MNMIFIDHDIYEHDIYRPWLLYIFTFIDHDIYEHDIYRPLHL